MTLASRERAALADALAEAGPNAPTLCAGWRTRELAAHLVLRETRADAGLVLAADGLAMLRPYADRVMHQVMSRSYDRLVHDFRTGPPRWSAFAVPGADALANTLEFFVHLEDVRRARPGWEPRRLRDEDARALWAPVCRAAAVTFLRAPVAAVLRVPGGPRARVGRAPYTVVLTGEVGELAMAVTGRDEARVTVGGGELAQDAYRSWRR